MNIVGSTWVRPRQGICLFEDDEFRGFVVAQIVPPVLGPKIDLIVLGGEVRIQ